MQMSVKLLLHITIRGSTEAIHWLKGTLSCQHCERFI